MNSKDIADLTGAGNYGKRFTVSEITMNGNTGHFLYRNKDAEKGTDGKYPKEDLGDTIEVVFLKIRRKLSVFKKGGLGKATSEHNTKRDVVVLYGTNPQDSGTAEDIRERYPELRTQQLVYCYFPAKREVVRVTIKGSSLGSEVKHPASVKKFYDYLQTFGEDTHVHEYFTKLVPVKEEGPQGDYYAASFVRGEKLTDEQQERVNEQILEVHKAIEVMDSNVRARVGAGAPVESPDEDDDEEMPTIQSEDTLESEFPEEEKTEYPDEEINPADIPF